MLDISGYQIKEQIKEDDKSRLYRAIREQDDRSILIGVLNKEYPTPAELARYRGEYDLMRSLRLEGVIRAYDLQEHQHTLIMLLEDVGGELLQRSVAERQLALDEFLPVAMRMVEIVGEVHAANVIHKNINPASFIWNRATGQLKLIDLSLATRLSRENPAAKNPQVLEGALVYISPEQTGRMNRTIDYRTDFYSLGVTFYEMLNGQLPFESADAMELVHSHIAKQPVPPRESGRHFLPTVRSCR